jgi:MoaA/NifB/PqqE/SkfB family radical SAM enzyme
VSPVGFDALKAQRRRRRRPGLLEMLGNCLAYNALPPLLRRPLTPHAMAIYVTYRCNMRCRICGIWRRNREHAARELSLDDFSRILSNRLFAKLRYVNINGGEPNLRLDLVDLTGMLVRRCTDLRALSLNSNGIPPGKTAENVRGIVALCEQSGIRFSVSLSLHMVGPGYDDIAGIGGAFAKVSQAFRELKELRRHTRFFLSANCVVTNLNAHALEELAAWGHEQDIPVNFIVGEVRDRFDNADMAGDVLLNGERAEHAARFFRKLAESRREYLQHALRYRLLADMIERGSDRTLGCHYFLGGVILGSDGLLYYCKKSLPIGDCGSRAADDIYFDEKNLTYRLQVLGNSTCRACPPNTFNQMEIEKDLPRVVRYLLVGP